MSSPTRKPVAHRGLARGGAAPAGAIGRRAFTLIELLVSLLLLSLLLTLVYGAFAQVSGPALALRDRLTEQQELRLLLRMVADDLRSAQWLERFAAKGTQPHTGIVARMRLEGGKQFTEISFHAARPARFHRGLDPTLDPRLHEVGYAVQLSEDRSRLELVRREDFYLDEDLEHGGLTVALADRIQEFRVQFLPPDADPDAAVQPWQDEWDSPSRPENARMPLAIRLTIGRADAAGGSLSESIDVNLPASLKL